MTAQQQDDLLEGEEDIMDEVESLSLDEFEDEEEEANTGHRVQTIAPDADGEDNYFDEKYFDE